MLCLGLRLQLEMKTEMQRQAVPRMCCAQEGDRGAAYWITGSMAAMRSVTIRDSL